MSLQQTALVDKVSVPNRAALQAAVDSLGFDCKIDAAYEPYTFSGFLPCVLAGRKSGCEISWAAADDHVMNFPHLDEPVGSREVAITFRWGGDLVQCACVLILSAALASSFGAIVHYEDDDMLYTRDRLIEEARSAVEGA